MRPIHPVFTLVIMLALASCKRVEDTPSPDVAPSQQAQQQTPLPPAAETSTPSEDSQQPAEVSADAVLVGASFENGAVVDRKTRFSSTETVHAAAGTAARPGARAYVYWTYQDGTTHHEESKTVSGPSTVFTFAASQGMVPGAYNVQIDINDVPVGLAEFTVE